MDATRTSSPELAGKADEIEPDRAILLADGEDDEQDLAPPVLEVDDHHMQVRALNLWAELLDENSVPSIENVSLKDDPDLGSHSILLDFNHGLKNPLISHFGEKLAAQCEVSRDIAKLEQASGSFLLDRLTNFCIPVFESRTPKDFETEWVNNDGGIVLYRGILLPFSASDGEIDNIFAFINWKVIDEPQYDAGSQPTQDVLLLDKELQNEERPHESEPILLLDQEAETSADANRATASKESDLHRIEQADPSSTLPQEEDTETLQSSQEARAQVSEAPTPDGAGGSLVVDDQTAEIDGGVTLNEWLAKARESASIARSSEERSRKALYEAVGRAYDFSLAAIDAPEDFAKLISDAGLSMQDRAPMTPIVKLVFGLDYDKTRLAEYAAALCYAHRMRLELGTFSEFLLHADGGLKGIVRSERQLRREEVGKTIEPSVGMRTALVKELLKITPKSLSDLPAEGDEFTLVLAHRLPDGHVAMLGEIPHDNSLLERAARRLVGACANDHPNP